MLKKYVYGGSSAPRERREKERLFVSDTFTQLQ